jgi:hypothetical protein
VVRVKTADRVAREAEHFAEDELPAPATLVGNAAAARRNDALTLFDQAIDRDRGIPLESVSLDLSVKGILAMERLMTMQPPHDVIGQARQDLRVVAATNPLMYLSTMRFRFDT